MACATGVRPTSASLCKIFWQLLRAKPDGGGHSVGMDKINQTELEKESGKAHAQPPSNNAASWEIASNIDAHSPEQREEKAHAEAQANATDPSPSMLGKHRLRNEPLKYFIRPALSAVPELPAETRNARTQPSAADGRFLLGALNADEPVVSCVVVPFAEFARRYFAKHKVK